MKKLIIAGISFLLIVSISIWIYTSATFSEGYRAGNIMKLSKKGIIFKTYEGQLNVGGIVSNNGDGLSNIWEFSVTNQGVIYQIENAVDRGKRVKLFYKEKYVKIPWRGKTKYIVYKLEEIKN